MVTDAQTSVRATELEGAFRGGRDADVWVF